MNKKIIYLLKQSKVIYKKLWASYVLYEMCALSPDVQIYVLSNRNMLTIQ